MTPDELGDLTSAQANALLRDRVGPRDTREIRDVRRSGVDTAEGIARARDGINKGMCDALERLKKRTGRASFGLAEIMQEAGNG